MENRIINSFWWFLEPRQWWIRHILFWMYRFNNYVFYGLGWQEIDFSPGMPSLVGEILLYIVFVYFHVLFLIPKVLFNKKITLYIIGSFLSIGFFMYNEFVLFLPEVEMSFFDNFHYPLINGIETYLQITGLRIMVEFLYTQKRLQELHTETLNTELAYLKSQINPHFLFNTLNNIAVLSEIYPEKVTSTIIDLSNVLRYQLYESEKEQVSLAKEIENLKQNLKLEALRLNDVQHDIRVEGAINGVMVAPLLFTPFLENAVKHSADPSGKVFIDMSFKIDENSLVFIAENSKPSIKAKQLAGGIGLKNIQRRLALLYPNKHTLSIEDTPTVFKVTLTLFLQHP
jgi:two-component system, LytTR family, sensor kinase